MEPVNAAVIYYSATGTVHALAQAAAEGAEKAGARVRMRRAAGATPGSITIGCAMIHRLRTV